MIIMIYQHPEVFAETKHPRDFGSGTMGHWASILIGAVVDSVLIVAQATWRNKTRRTARFGW